MTDRMTAEQYRAMLAGAKPKAHGSARGEQGSAVGTCRVCGGHVGQHDPAQFEVDDFTGVAWCRHLGCR